MFTQQNSLALAFLAVLGLASALEVDTPDEIDVGEIISNTTEDFIDGNFTDIFDELEVSSALGEESESNNTFTDVEFDCTCDDFGAISCVNPSDEKACTCEDNDIFCEDIPMMDEPEPMVPIESPSIDQDVIPPPTSFFPDEPQAPDGLPVDDSASSTKRALISMAVSVVGVVMVWN